jgi:hypothetical protein
VAPEELQEHLCASVAGQMFGEDIRRVLGTLDLSKRKFFVLMFLLDPQLANTNMSQSPGTFARYYP